MESWVLIAVGLAVAVSIFLIVLFFRSGRKARPAVPVARKPEVEVLPTEGTWPVPQPLPEVAPPAPPKPRRKSSLAVALEKFWQGHRLEKSEDWDSLEEALLEGDVGPATAGRLLDIVRQSPEVRGGDASRAMAQLKGECVRMLEAPRAGLVGPDRAPDSLKPWVVSLVGVNGAGKTTTVGKLAKRYASQDKKVLLGAVDTFRAAAVEQLRVWAERTKSDFVHGRDGGDPGAVAFDAVSAGKARGCDVVLLDTAGRLHTKTNLMDELTRVHKVITKVEPAAPHEIWLVLDGTLGQNSVQQAREFSQALKLTGVIVTKLDGTAKGGAVLAIAAELKLPVRFIGLGEGLDDLVPFEPAGFVDSLLT